MEMDVSYVPVIWLVAWLSGMLLVAGVVISILEYLEYRDACLAADAYLECTLDRVTDLWAQAGTVTSEARNLLVLFDKREAMVHRPYDSWALSPYATELLEAVQ